MKGFFYESKMKIVQKDENLITGFLELKNEKRNSTLGCIEEKRKSNKTKS